jgi:hypothetical protein
MINFKASIKYLLMKSIRYTLIIVGAILVCSGCLYKDEGLLHSREGRFEIRFPGKYKDTLITLDHPDYGILAKRVISAIIVRKG